MSFNFAEKPAFVSPPNACDAHFHVFGPSEIYPYGADLRYKPPYAPLEEYLKLAKHIGLTRFVFVQPSAYERDNRCMLDAMRVLGPDTCRGVVDIDEHISDEEMRSMHALGVRGVRINVSPIHPYENGLSQFMTPRILHLNERCQEMGWHLDFLLPGWLTAELLPVMRALKVPFSMAHMGMNLAVDGVDAPGFKALLDLLNHGQRLAYVKLTGIYRMSKLTAYTDADPMAKALLKVAPDRIIWGSDYPHLSFAQHSSIDLFNLLHRWCEKTQDIEQILVQNPQRLFDF